MSSIVAAPRATSPLVVDGRLPLKTMLFLGVASFGAGMSFIVPTTFTLAHRVSELYPGQSYLLGTVLSGAAILSIVLGPLAGLFSDRHRSRFGRRRPFLVVSALIGLAGLPILATASSLPLLTIGWLISSAGWNTAMGMVMFTVADIAPPTQRGQLTGIVGLFTQVSPVIGVPLVGLVSHSPLAMFAVPFAVAVVGVLVFCLKIKETDSRSMELSEPMSPKLLAASFVFNPLEHRGFAFAWAGRCFFFLAMGLATTFQTFFYAHRLQIPVSDIAPTIALITAAATLPALVGSVILGRISDRIGRGPIIAFATITYAAGAATMAASSILPLLIFGALLSHLGFAAFMAAGQATVLDVIPNPRETGRFMAINQFAQKVPMAIAPLVGPVIMTWGGGSYSNYTALLLVAGAAALVGGTLMRQATRYAKPPVIAVPLDAPVQTDQILAA